MKQKRTKGGLLLLIILLCLTAMPVYADADYGQQQEIQMVIDGQTQQSMAAPLNVYGTILVPFRELFEAFGMDVSWNEERKEVTATGNGHTILLYLGAKEAYVDGAFAQMTQAPLMVEGALYVPARFVSESLGYEVDWEAGAKRVVITTQQEAEKAAKEETATPTLTYEEAIKVGLRKNYSVQAAEIGKKQAQAQNKDLLVSYSYYDAALWQAKDDLQTAEKWAGISLDITKEQTAYNVRRMMDAVSVQLDEQDALDSKMAYLKEKNRITQAKYAQGLVSKAESDSAKKEYESAQQEEKTLENKIEAARIQLRTALDGALPQDAQLEYTFTYAPVGEVDLDRKYKDALYADPYLWYAEQSVASADYKLVTYTYTMNGKDYELTELDLVSAKTNAANVKRQLAQSIQSRYNALLQLEDGLDALQLQLEQAKAGLRQSLLLYESGMAIKADVLNCMQGIKTLEYEREKAMLSHCQMKESFAKMYLAPDYLSGGGA